MSIEIVFETHSTSTDNETGIATGWLDGRLSQRGRVQAEELGRRRRSEGVAAVFTSDLGRALETVEIAFAGTSIPVHEDWRLRECNYGELNGMPSSRLEAERVHHVESPFPGGESYRRVVERVQSFLSALPPELEGKRIVVVGHSATRWALDHLLAGAPLAELVAAPFDWREGWEYVFSRE